MNEADDTPRDEALSRRYREAAVGAPPPALDARILAAAQAAVQPPLPSPTPARPWWQCLRLPLGVAATALLATMLSLTVQRQTPETLDVETARPQSAPVPSATPARPEAGVEREAVAPERRDAVAQPAPAEPARAAPPAAAPRPAAKGAAAPAAQAMPSAPTAFPAAAESGAPAPAAAPASAERAVMPEMKKEVPAANAVERQEARTADAVTTKPAAAPAVSGAAAKRAAPLPPDAWLDEIRALRRDGRRDEAARRLDEFRRAYPDYPLPADLRD